MKRTARFPKTVWHPLSLQQLAPSQFTQVVNRILSGRYSLVAETLTDATIDGDLRSQAARPQPESAVS